MTERVTPEPVVERDSGGTTYVDRGGSGFRSVSIGIAILALAAATAVVLVNHNRNEALHTDAVTSASSSMADSAAPAVNPAK
jgi:hypothetical protein